MEWKQLKENPLYEISEYGDVRRYGSNILSPTIRPDGYHRLTLVREDKSKHFEYVQRLVASNYLPPPTPAQIEWAQKTKRKKVQVNHKDRNKSNNHYSNLEWSTGKENIIHAHDTGIHDDATPIKKIVKYESEGIRHVRTKLTEKEINEVIQLYKPYSHDANSIILAERYNTTPPAIMRYIKKYSKR